MQVQRRLNSTGRKRINQADIDVLLAENEGSVPRYDAQIDLSKYDLSPDAKVFVEAYHRESTQRFEHGTVGNLTAPPDTRLTQVDVGGQILFRVKVVGKDCLLLASADKVTPRSPGDDETLEGLMPVKTKPLGQVLWRVQLDPDTKPVLLLNNRVPSIKDRIVSDPVFQGLILPGALREVLNYICWNDDEGSGDSSWQAQWLDLAEKLGSGERPVSDDPDESRDWIDEVVEHFSSKHHLCNRVIDSCSKEAT